MGAFQFAGFSFGTVGANGGGDRPLDAPPINSFIVWRGNKVHSNGGFSIASDVDMTPGAELREGHQSTGAQPFTSEVLLEANTVQDSAVPFARGSGATAVGGILLRGNSFADEVVDNDGSSILPPLRSDDDSARVAEHQFNGVRSPLKSGVGAEEEEGKDVTPPEYFGVRVVDSSSGRGIPAARVSVLHWLDQWSDSLGYVAFQEPALATPTQLFVTVESDNYDKLAVSLNASLGRSLSLQLRRQLPAERLYRVTGPGIFRDAVLLGAKLPPAAAAVAASDSDLSHGIAGQDAMISAQFRDKIVLSFGDTRSASDGAGQTMTSNALAPTQAFSRERILDGLPLSYSLSPSGETRPSLPLHVSERSVCEFGMPFARKGTNDSSVEIGALSATSRGLFVVFTKRPRGNMGPSWADCTTCCWGIARYDIDTRVYRPQVLFPLKSPMFGRVTASQSLVTTEDGVERIYFTVQKPIVRVAVSAIANLSAFEEVAVASPFTDQDINRAAVTHVASAGLFVMIAEGREPRMGDILAATAKSLAGPWSSLCRIASSNLTHNALYNPSIHTTINGSSGAEIIWSATLSDGYTTNSVHKQDGLTVPRYNYEVIMHRVRLDDILHCSTRPRAQHSVSEPSTVLKGDDRGDTTQQVVDCYLRTDLDAAKCSKDGRFDLYQLVNNRTWAGPVVGINCCGGKGGTVVPGAPEPFGTGIPLAQCKQACQTSYSDKGCTGIIVSKSYNITDQCTGVETQCSPEICDLKPGQISRLLPGTYYHDKQIFLPRGSAIIGAGVNITHIVACGERTWSGCNMTKKRGFLMNDGAVTAVSFV